MFTDRQLIYICIFVIVVVYIIFSKVGKKKIENEVGILLRYRERSYKDEYEKKARQLKTEYEEKENSLRKEKSYLQSLIQEQEDIVYLKTSSNIERGIEQSRSIFQRYPVFEGLKEYDHVKNPRLKSAITDKMSFVTVPSVHADIQGKSGNTYHVTLNSCTCPDYTSRHIPCKHMYRLALQVGLLAGYDSSSELAKIESYRTSLSELSSKEAVLLNSIQKLSSQKDFLETSIEEIRRDAMGSSWLAVQLADLEFLSDQRRAAYLRKKARPALKAADEVDAIAKEKREWMAKAKALEYQLAFYESINPSLSDVTEYTPEEVSEAITEELDESQKYLPQDEYNLLSEAERWQLALDKWRNRQRSNWQVGRDFERYIGYLYEMDGYRVEFFGALEGKMDLGRDLIARKKNEVIIIQCKRWSDRKIIHEKHVFQLFGSVFGYEMEHPGSSPKGLLVTTCPLSDTAIAYAGRLNIEYKHNYPTDGLDSYPLIKCNIGRTGERIFHLPFDQQYDRVNINSSNGEFYAHTVQDAIDAGFRRAYRWHGS